MQKHIQKINILVLIVYIVFILPYISKPNLLIFGNMFMRLLFIGLIILAGVYDSLISILLSVAFIFTHIKYQEISDNNLSNRERLMLERFIEDNNTKK